MNQNCEICRTMKNYEPGEITLTEIPADVDLNRILLNKNQCQDNAYKTTRDYDHRYVEGVIILVDLDNGSKSAAQAWNESKAGHFDVTTTLWEGVEYDEIKEIKYLPVLSYSSDEMPQGGIGFSADTLALVDYLNTVADWKYKPQDEVVLKDPNSGRAVASAVVTWFDPVSRIYEVNILRLKNIIPFAWPEKDMEKATPERIRQAETLLAQLELASDLLVGSEDIKDKPEETIVEFKIDVPEYIVYYKQLHIDGAVKWRLIAMKTIPAKK